MSLDKAIGHGKERRRPYEGSKAVDKTCRNHGSCDWCAGNRLHSARRRVASMGDKVSELDMYHDLAAGDGTRSCERDSPRA